MTTDINEGEGMFDGDENSQIVCEVQKDEGSPGGDDEPEMGYKFLKVEGPPDSNEGFIRDFLMYTNALDDSILHTAGDSVKFNISCEGYDVDNSILFPETSNDPGQGGNGTAHDNNDAEKNTTGTLQKSPEEAARIVAGEDSEDNVDEDSNELENVEEEIAKRFKLAKWVNITLTPLPDTPRLTSSTVITVTGLEAKLCSPFMITLSPDHALARFISYDNESGEITLRVASVEMWNDEEPRDFIYLEDARNATEISSPFLQNVWDHYQNAAITEGVLYSDDAVPDDVSMVLNRQIDELAAKEPVDYHPGSKDCVRDLVHPSLYPFVRGESAVTDDAQQVLRAIAEYNREMKNSDDQSDRWGRPFEASKYQWLPTVFEIDLKKRVSIDGYINNLDRDKYGTIYDSLARLFETFLPYFQEVYGYVQQLVFLPKGEDNEHELDHNYNHDPDFDAKQLTDKPVRVITKIVDYELKSADDVVEGVFHAEGMSSDHVLLTGVYVLRRDDDFSGGDLTFKRQFLNFEGAEVHLEIKQCRHWRAEKIVEENFVPLGKLETPQGRLIVFPNSHIHCLSKMVREATKGVSERAEISHRCVVVFWVVDPEREVMTTQLVPRQQGVMLEERAKQHRLALMEERRMMKGTLNGERKVHLCEH